MSLLAAGLGATFRDTVLSGPVLLAAPVAVTAGLVSFLSPCVLPLVPGYLSYVTGLSGSDLAGTAEGSRAGTAAAGSTGGTGSVGTLPAPGTRTRGRRTVVLGSVLFVLGFSAVFISAGALFGGLGARLQLHSTAVNRVLGVVTILMGLAFMGLLPALQRDVRVHRLPPGGLAGAPLLGVLFGVGWTPCLGPTLGAVQGLAYTSSSAGRGALLTGAYCVGLGAPFILTGLAYRRALGAFAVVKRHYVWVMRAGGGLLVVLGLLLVTGAWDSMVTSMRSLITGFETAV